MTINKILFNNKKCQRFLSFFYEEIILQEPDNKWLKILGIKYKNLLNIFGDYDEIRKYLQYLEKQKFIKLKHISKQRVKDKKIPNDTYISKKTPDNILLTGDKFYEVMRYHKINYYPEDLFIFEYNKRKIQQFLDKETQARKRPAEYKDGILRFRGKEIDFRNKQNQKDLLTTLFEDPKKNWYYDEIQEKWDINWKDIKETNSEAKNYWRKFYNAGDDINTAVATETQIKDFIIKNTKEIRINPKYI